MKKLSLCCLLLLFLLPVAIQAQGVAPATAPNTADDSVYIESGQDTVLIKSYATRYDPRKALLYAAVLPGLGQIYNKKYWKLPLVYGGFGALGYAVGFYQKGYKKYKAQLFDNINEAPNNENFLHPVSELSTGQLRTIVTSYRRQRDFWLIMTGAMYLLQIVDAHVDAHLKEFDVNPNLQVSLEPLIEQDAVLGRQSGVALIIKF
ncbi:hypothetical protein KK062_10830 [Fulvivirgaceae bacterium PWU5]|uniref:DUF5683 domain-containing protein n=1 Tax=Dawidia cretensis TaxID=2782350 RepID=A0AAP2DZ40_9BACT|nr:DUF5683 domain-containing protein [Dawidia cretensis]MBT1708722.1 hypothetical protein [Dawidia cretensis]